MKYEIRRTRSSALNPLLRLSLQFLAWTITLHATGAPGWMLMVSKGLLALCALVTLITALVFRIRAPELLRRQEVVEEVEVGAVAVVDAPLELDR